MATVMTRPQPTVRVEQLARMRRSIRRPKHTFHIKHRPWEIAPFLVAPVLPGETMKNLLMQARVLTDPIRSQLIGWWCEHYFFYCRHRMMGSTAAELSTGITNSEVEQMHLNPEFDLLGNTNGEADDRPQFYHDGSGASGVNWTRALLGYVVAHWFRDEGESILMDGFATEATGGLPVARAIGQRENFMDSLSNAADFAVHDVTVDVDSGVPDTVSMAAIDQAMRTYEWLRTQNLVDMSFEQFLETHGVAVPAAEDDLPELLRYERSWQYPSNQVDPDAGSVRSVVSWSPVLRADKDRFFREPGFVFGVSVVRPKVYLANQPKAAAHALSKAVDWLPAVLAGDAWASYRHHATGTGPLPVLTDADGYWLDLKDLFLYGDQFINFDYASATDMSLVALPAAGGGKRYPILDDAKKLFVDATADVATRVRQDGVVSLMIAGRQQDMIRSTT